MTLRQATILRIVHWPFFYLSHRSVPRRKRVRRASSSTAQVLSLVHQAIALVAVCSACACDRPPPDSPPASQGALAPGLTRQSSKDRDGFPVVLVYRCAAESPSEGGVELAVWEDGYVLYASNPEKAGRDIISGMVTPQRVQALLNQLDLAGVFSLSGDSFLVPDGPELVLAAEFGGKRNRHRWDEVIRPGWGANVHPTKAYIEFVCMWVSARIALSGFLSESQLGPRTVHGIVRGYNCDEPWGTPWLETVGAPESSRE